MIKHTKEDIELMLWSEDMNKKIQKIIEWQTMSEYERSYFEKMVSLKSEMDSGWYYENNYR